ncbi:MAG TPA: bifunctional phosphoribosylaminoimidazolecarboxamide formyltransferase/IMP cyclohydrolase, partial [Thermoanaerobaculia bacterium]|nr:bifunctional phosphoribosylaminoimidazolecarboxamide formyltransferase/IMP cyclohydrolase [Thermoanaerobaculia bacterium]
MAEPSVSQGASSSPADFSAVRRALISVHDKEGIAEFARALTDAGVRIVSTGGTAAHLRDAGVPVSLVEEITGFPEILGGRVKTLHPRVFGGVLADDSRDDHARDMKQESIEAFDLVAVNLYPFEKTVAAGKARGEVIEMIDVGGPAMIRAAAKNHKRVAVIVDPADYATVLQEVRASGGTSLATRERLAARAFS